MSYLLPHLHTGYAVDRAIVEVRTSELKDGLMQWYYLQTFGRVFLGHV